MGPGNNVAKGLASTIPEDYRGGSDFELNPSGLNLISPQCARSKLGIGFDLDISACAGLGFMICQPALRDRGQAGILTDKVRGPALTIDH
jgi:hypothetical protein